MKSIKDLREQYNLVVEKEEHDMNKLTQLVRAGLFDAKKLSALKRAMEKPADKMTAQEKRMMINLLDSLMAEVLSDKQVYRKIKQDVMREDYKNREYLSGPDPKIKRFGYPSQKDAPTVLLLKRKSIRVFPDGQKVALYYAQAIDKYVSIPYSEIGINEEVELDEGLGGAIVKGAIAAGKTVMSKGKKVYDAYKAKQAANVAAQAKKAEQAKNLAASRRKALSDKAAKPGSKKAKETRASTVSNKIKSGRRKPGLLSRIGRGLAAAASAISDSSGSGSDSGSEPKYFTPMSSKIQANVSGPKKEGGADARAERERQASLRASKAVANESVNLDGNIFELNNKEAQKVTALYESLNKKNKKKMVELMNESADSLQKIVSFAVRQ